MLAYDLPTQRRSAATPSRLALLRRARLSARAVSADAGTIRDSAGAARLLAAAVGELLQSRRDARARRRTAPSSSPSSRRRRDGPPTTAVRSAIFASRRSSTRWRRASAIRCCSPCACRERATSSCFRGRAVGVPWGSLVKGDERVQVDTTARKIAGSKEFDWVLTPQDRRRARSAADSISVLQSGLASLRSRVDDADARARRRGVARVGRHGAHRNAARASHALSRTAASRRFTSIRVFWALLALVPLPALIVAHARAPS